MPVDFANTRTRTQAELPSPTSDTHAYSGLTHFFRTLCQSPQPTVLSFYLSDIPLEGESNYRMALRPSLCAFHILDAI